ncbi:rho GTPase-activating protein Graf [Lutzomyia longipalpis]|uniref:Oligophrenin-1 n=1 Tax=Lutzomyia longipalpis TaxID=7200 RepID=A0A1B0C9A1_LUTLO|nr:rho GTPase-activating protein Graf [Lutzomyia longipalpis]XP_055692237.1 rho GTPase-activating protein Graf [Lutzomyia longipalpis]XP_055692238.1 rho GTPase-activating protein Graf [Lutzomyia longipalpis]
MVIGLQALEFTDCLLDTPDFRENLSRHEKELDKTSQQIKRIIKEIKDLLTAARNLSRAQRALSKSLGEFNFEFIGSNQTEDEQTIVASLENFSQLIAQIEEERGKILQQTQDEIVGDLENFRKDHIGGVKENKKTFCKKTAKFCQAQERFLNMSTKKSDNIIQEADASLGMLEREYLRESLSYVLRIQEVQERIKFEFVETILRFMSGWLLFYHLGHEISEDSKEYIKDLQLKVQKTRENFDETRTKAEELKAKYMDSKMKPETEYTKQGYLFLLEKKAFTATWSKYYCTYKKDKKQFSMVFYNQISGRTEAQTEIYNLLSCTRRASDFEKRFCFDLTFEQKPGIVYTFQGLSEEDRKSWLNAMDGKEPTYLTPGKSQPSDEYHLDDVGFAFVRKCIEILENRGLEEEGLYRIGGIGTKINKILSLGMDRKKNEKERFSFITDDQHSDLLESKTIASALKHYLRNLNEPLMTFRYHKDFIAAAKMDTRIQRLSQVHTLVYRLPKSNFEMLEIVIRHLKAVSMKCHKNKMSVFNLGVVFGPTLLRAVSETVASILDIKFNNVVIEILIENYDLIFKTSPGRPNDYLLHSNQPETIPRGQYHGTRYSQQPLVRVVTKSNYTDPVMSSSLQNIPNGMMLYQNNSPMSIPGSSFHQKYELKSSTGSSQSTHSLPHQEVKLSPREIAMSTAIRNSTRGQEPHQSNHHSYTNVRKVRDLSRDAKAPAGRTTNGDEVYEATKRLNAMTYSESNLIQPREIAIVDRMNSTSSSNESVCSTPSRDLMFYTGKSHIEPTATNSATAEWPYSHHTTQQNNTSQNVVPKKNYARNRYHGNHKDILWNDQVRVRTLYACMAENDGELSFEPNQIITNVKPSSEAGWLEGTLNGKSGLIPQNYVELIP